ncbi:hypothetical protein Lal_00011231, partial [Lupinus albus]
MLRISNPISERLKLLANGPSIHVLSYTDIDAQEEPFIRRSQSRDSGPTTDDCLYRRDDHDEGLWMNQYVLSNKDNASLKRSKKRKG